MDYLAAELNQRGLTAGVYNWPDWNALAGDAIARYRMAPDRTRIMLVGHEPDFSSLIGALTGGSRVLMKKGGLGRVDIDMLEEGAGTLAWLLPPRALRD